MSLDLIDVNPPGREFCGSVWLADDNEPTRVLLREIIRSEFREYNCQVFSDAENLLAALESGISPEVVLLDLNMPGMGGLAAIRLIKALAPKAKVFILTTFFCPATKREALAAGASAFLLKRMSFPQILTEIRKVFVPAPQLLKSAK